MSNTLDFRKRREDKLSLEGQLWRVTVDGDVSIWDAKQGKYIPAPKPQQPTTQIREGVTNE